MVIKTEKGCVNSIKIDCHKQKRFEKNRKKVDNSIIDEYCDYRKTHDCGESKLMIGYKYKDYYYNIILSTYFPDGIISDNEGKIRTEMSKYNEKHLKYILMESEKTFKVRMNSIQNEVELR